MATKRNNHGLPANVLTAARNATSGATMARAFGFDGRRTRDAARALGFYANDPARTLDAYKVDKVPAFDKVREDLIAALAPKYLKRSAPKGTKAPKANGTTK